MTERAALRLPSRFPVDALRDADAGAIEETLRAELARLELQRPSGGSYALAPFGFAYRREPDVFSAVGVGAALGTCILLVEFAWAVSYFTIVARVGAAAALVAAFWLAARFLRNFGARFEVLAEGPELVVRHTVFGSVRRERRFPAGQIVEVRVDRREGPPRVVLGGPRHELLGEIYQLRLLDPDALAAWMAQMCAVVAKRASLERRVDGGNGLPGSRSGDTS